MKPILFDFPMPIITPRLILKPPQVGEQKELAEKRGIDILCFPESY